MFIEERHQAILAKLETDQRIFVNDVANLFNVSIDTIRRDLSILEEKGLLKRTHGGAIRLGKVRQRSKYPLDEVEHFPHFDGVGRKAAEYLSDGDTIFIGGSKLTYVMLRYIPENIRLTVVTNSIQIAAGLKDHPRVEIFLTGGRMGLMDLMIDSIAQEFVRKLRFDVCFITSAGTTAQQGLTCTNSDSAAFYRLVVEASRKTICLQSNEKIGYEGFVKMVDAAAVQVIITDKDTLEEEIVRLRNLGIQVIVV